MRSNCGEEINHGQQSHGNNCGEETNYGQQNYGNNCGEEPNHGKQNHGNNCGEEINYGHQSQGWGNKLYWCCGKDFWECVIKNQGPLDKEMMEFEAGR